MANAIVTTDDVDVTIDLSGLREVLEGLFNQHPEIQGDINKAWGMIQVMGAQMESLGKTIGSLNRLVVLLKEQRDELLEDNAKQWDEGYQASEKVKAFMQGRDSFNQKILTEEISSMVYDAMFVQTDLDDALLFAEALASGELVIDEGEIITELVARVAERVREQQADELEADDDER